MEEWNRIRQQVLRDGVSIRAVMRETGYHYSTIRRILDNSSPPEFACPAREKTKVGPYLERIAGIIKSDKTIKKKQRHTAKRIFEVISAEGYEGSYTTVKNVVRELKKTSREVFVPLIL